MSAVEPSGSVAGNCKKGIVNRAVCPYNAHGHHNSWALEQVFMEAAGSHPSGFVFAGNRTIFATLRQKLKSFQDKFKKSLPHQGGRLG